MDFGMALNLMRGGFLVTRRGWNGKGQYLAYVPRRSLRALDDPDYPLVRSLPHLVDETVTCREYIVISTVEGDLVPWVASQTDLLADDWHEHHIGTAASRG